MGQAGDEVEIDIADAGRAEAGDLIEAHLAGVEAADGGGLAVDEGLDAEAHAVEAVALKGFEGFVGELAGSTFKGDFGTW